MYFDFFFVLCFSKKIFPKSIYMFRKFFSHEIKKVNFIFTSGSLSRTNIESWCHLYHTLSSHIAIKCSCADIFFSTALAVLFTLVDSGIDVVVVL